MDKNESILGVEEVVLIITILILLIPLFSVYLGPLFTDYLDILRGYQGGVWYSTASFIFVIIDIILFCLVIYSVLKRKELEQIEFSSKMEVHIPAPEEEIKEVWLHVQDLMKSANPSDWNMAILRADALIDEILQEKGYQGDGLGERLKIIDPRIFKSYDRLWSAHRLRNSIAHEPGVQHNKEIIEHAIDAYQQALFEIRKLK